MIDKDLDNKLTAFGCVTLICFSAWIIGLLFLARYAEFGVFVGVILLTGSEMVHRLTQIKLVTEIVKRALLEVANYMEKN